MIQSLTISIPIYNDAGNIVQLLDELDTVLSALPVENIKILVIDDGSKDNGAELVRLRQDPRIELLIHEKNLGFGITIKQLLDIPATEWIFFISGDHQFPADNLIKLIQYAEDYDFILGKREKRADNIYRRINSWVYNHLINFFFDTEVTDINSIFLVKKKALASVQLHSTSAFIHAELYLSLHRKKTKILETIIRHQPRISGVGSGGKLHIIVPVIKDMFMAIKQNRYHDQE